MLRNTAHVSAGSVFLTLMMLSTQTAQQTAAAQTPSTKHAVAKRAAPQMTNAQKIALAMSAGPAAIAQHAAIVDMTGTSNATPKQLRTGTNGWVCYAFIGEPMCLDKEWQKWMQAWMSKGDLQIDGTGIGYMLRGDKGASNTDPYATKPTVDNQWVVAPPHIMVLYQDPKALDTYPTDWKGGGPWVMWKGTAYAHLMVPVSRTHVARPSSK